MRFQHLIMHSLFAATQQHISLMTFKAFLCCEGADIYQPCTNNFSIFQKNFTYPFPAISEHNLKLNVKIAQRWGLSPHIFGEFPMGHAPIPTPGCMLVTFVFS